MTHPEEPKPTRARFPWWFALVAVALVAARARHLGEVIHGPHSGRQCDAAFYALDFYRNGIDLFHPSVCWLGAHKTLALEFPLPEALMALGYRAFGPTLLVARLLTLACYLGSALYLYRIVAHLRSPRTAKLAVLFYLAAPLAINYSRAVHVDFWAVFCAHAMLYYLLRGYDDDRTGLIVLATAFGTLAFLIKAPYAFYLFFPFGLHVLAHLKLKRLLAWTPILILPLVAFALWRWHAVRINSAAPDWTHIYAPERYFKFTKMGWWYFGTLAQRRDLANWVGIARNVVTVVTGSLGLYFLILGLVVRPGDRRAVHFFKVWLGGVLVYVAIFFNLNIIHDYYQIPFLAPVAFFIALALEWLFLERESGPGLLARVPFALTMVLLLGLGVRRAESYYFKTDWARVTAGAKIREHTPEDALVIASPSQANTWWWDARLLYRARRLGWSVRASHLTEANIRALATQGATHLAIVTDEPVPSQLTRLLETSPKQEFGLRPESWRLHLYTLDKTLKPGEPEAKP